MVVTFDLPLADKYLVNMWPTLRWIYRGLLQGMYAEQTHQVGNPGGDSGQGLEEKPEEAGITSDLPFDQFIGEGFRGQGAGRGEPLTYPWLRVTHMWVTPGLPCDEYRNWISPSHSAYPLTRVGQV